LFCEANSHDGGGSNICTRWSPQSREVWGCSIYYTKRLKRYWVLVYAIVSNMSTCSPHEVGFAIEELDFFKVGTYPDLVKSTCLGLYSTATWSKSSKTTWVFVLWACSQLAMSSELLYPATWFLVATIWRIIVEAWSQPLSVLVMMCRGIELLRCRREKNFSFWTRNCRRNLKSWTLTEECARQLLEAHCTICFSTKIWTSSRQARHYDYVASSVTLFESW